MTTIYKLKEIIQNFILFFPIFLGKTLKMKKIGALGRKSFIIEADLG